MRLEKIDVDSRDEYREAQEPRGFRWRGKHYKIEEVLDRWFEGHPDSRRMPLRYFRVKTSDGGVFIIRYHELFGAWGIAVPDSEEDE